MASKQSTISFMAERATFTGFDPYTLTGVAVTDRELGHGSYATVIELEYNGLKCAGKKVHELLLRQGDTSYTVQNFEKECHMISHVRHPNIVQFLGVYFQQGVRVPILVMEFLPINLTSCIEQYGILPKDISYSILHDVALGLHYLHSQTPLIIHRDLSSNNVLLTSNMMAKISDLGVARILNLTPLQVSRMTQTPGTPAYMPPEVMVANPKYNTSVDEFSYGILMIHMFSGQWPEPQVGPNRIGPNSRLIPVTEAERREVFLRAIGNNHPLMDLILKCINNHPKSRAHTSKIVERLTEMVLQFPAPLANRLDILRQINALEAEKLALTENGKRKDLMIQEKENEISTCRQEAHAQEEQKAEEISQLKLLHSSEVEHLHLQLQDLNTDNQLMKAETEAEITELKSKITTLETEVENKTNNLIKKGEQLEMQLIREREENRKLTTEKHDLQSKLYELEAAVSKLETNIAEYKSTIWTKETSAKRMGAEIDAKSKALAEKAATISAMSEQVSKTREYLTLNKQVRTIKLQFIILY